MVSVCDSFQNMSNEIMILVAQKERDATLRTACCLLCLRLSVLFIGLLMLKSRLVAHLDHTVLRLLVLTLFREVGDWRHLQRSGDTIKTAETLNNDGGQLLHRSTNNTCRVSVESADRISHQTSQKIFIRLQLFPKSQTKASRPRERSRY